MKISKRIGLILRNGISVADVLLSRQFHRAPHCMPILLLFLTNRCNLRCRMCGICEPVNSKPEGEKRELDTEEWFAVLDAAHRLHTILVSITGGEPLLRPDVYDIIRHASDLDMSVHMCSNGVLLTEERVKRLRDSGLGTLSISVESPVRVEHEALRGPNTFERALEGIRRVRELAPDIQVGINYLITKANMRHMRDMVAFSESLGVHQLKFAPIHTNLLHREKDEAEFEGLLFEEADIEHLREEIRALAERTEKSSLLTTSQAFLEGIPDLYSRPRNFKCFAGYIAAAINPSGHVAPCCDMDSPLSVRDMPLDVLWRSAEFKPLRRQVDACKSACWDTTNTEFSLRLRPTALLGELVRTWKDLDFYFGEKKS